MTYHASKPGAMGRPGQINLFLYMYIKCAKLMKEYERGIEVAAKLPPPQVSLFAGGASSPGLLLAVDSGIFVTTFAAALLRSVEAVAQRD